MQTYEVLKESKKFSHVFYFLNDITNYQNR